MLLDITGTCREVNKHLSFEGFTCKITFTFWWNMDPALSVIYAEVNDIAATSLISARSQRQFMLTELDIHKCQYILTAEI